MNNRVFKRIKQELIKSIEKKKRFTEQQPRTTEAPAIENTRIANNAPVSSPVSVEIVPEKLELSGAHPILTQKLSSSLQTPVKKTDHSLNNLSSNQTPAPVRKIDPYREIPE